jgi:hypothetical protein
MFRFQRIQTDKNLINHIIDKLNEIGYIKIPDFIGGDEDFLMIDTLRKEYIWCEYGFAPFCSDEEMYQYEFNDNSHEINLKKLQDFRH